MDVGAAMTFGVFSLADGRRRIGVRAGEEVLDAAAALPRFADLLSAPVLNPLLAAGPDTWAAVREAAHDALDRAEHRVALADATLHLPIEVADYVDFFSNEHHARNAGEIFRPGQDPLPTNWKHIPIGYHGRAGSIVVSGTPIVRPCGMRRSSAGPVYGPSRRLDIEAELGFVVGVGSPLGSRVPVTEFAERVFGVFLLNDWSARDLQAFETVPLGPFLGKSFATSVSPWVVPLADLSAARVDPPARDPEPADHLRDAEPWGLDITMEVRLNGHVISRPPVRENYWTGAQQLAHMTVNGAPSRTGDVYGSGTVSGPEREQRGCLLELSWGGKEPITLPDGSTRTFLEDGDEVVISATAPGPDGSVVDLGAVAGTVLPARTG